MQVEVVYCTCCGRGCWLALKRGYSELVSKVQWLAQEETSLFIWEATQIELHPSNMNKEGFSMRNLWKPLLQTLKDWKKAPFSKEKWLTPLHFHQPRISPSQEPFTCLLWDNKNLLHNAPFPTHYLVPHSFLGGKI